MRSVAEQALRTVSRRRLLGAGMVGVGLAAMPKSLAHATAAIDGTWRAAPQPRAPLTSRELMVERAKLMLDRHKDQFQLRDRIAVADFSVASREHRFHIVDLIAGRADPYLVSHGKGSDPEHTGMLQMFSNVPDSEASSDGVYRTGEMYVGQHGQSMRLHGLSPTNSNAFDRAIVIHGADYVTEEHIARWGKIGRSQGCFAVAPHMLPQVLAMLGPGRMLYSGRV